MSSVYIGGIEYVPKVNVIKPHKEKSTKKHEMYALYYNENKEHEGKTIKCTGYIRLSQFSGILLDPIKTVKSICQKSGDTIEGFFPKEEMPTKIKELRKRLNYKTSSEEQLKVFYE